jgi:hypothetical protein
VETAELDGWAADRFRAALAAAASAPSAVSAERGESSGGRARDSPRAALAVACAVVVLYATRCSTRTVLVEPCGDRTFGHVTSLDADQRPWVMRFDPEWFTSGLTASVAAAEDGVVPRASPSRTTTTGSTRATGC